VDDLGVKSWGECGRGRGVYIDGRCSRSDLDARIFGDLESGSSEVGSRKSAPKSGSGQCASTFEKEN